MNNIPKGIGGNVHSELIPTNLLSPMFQWVRFDMQGFKGNPKDVYNFYSKANIKIVWLIANYKHISTLHTSGIANVCVEIFNEPDVTFSSRAAYTPAQYLSELKTIYSLCLVYGYTVLAPGIGSWNMKWLLNFVYLGGLKYCHGISIHPYGVNEAGDLWEIIDTCRKAFPDKPLVFTEWAMVGASAKQQAAIIKQSMFENIPFCIYDIPFTDPKLAYLDSENKPTALYKDISTILGFSVSGTTKN